jgi:hypothetical protein
MKVYLFDDGLRFAADESPVLDFFKEFTRGIQRNGDPRNVPKTAPDASMTEYHGE